MLGKKDYWKIALTFIIALGLCLTALAELEKPIPVMPSMKVVNDNNVAAVEQARHQQFVDDYKANAEQPASAPVLKRFAAVDAKTNPYQSGPGINMGDRTDLMFEGFEGGVIPPTGWTTVVNNPYTWEIDTYAPFEGSYNATCVYDETYTGTQDEWIISPAVSLTGLTNALLEFEFNGSYYWATGTYQNYDLNVFISTDDGANWTQIWNQDDHPDWISDDITWVWLHTSIDLSAYIGQTVKVAFNYYGYDGAQFSVDAVSINDGALPTGRCCYGDPIGTSCIDEITEADCVDVYAGVWANGLNCTDDPCPEAPANDVCTSAEYLGGSYPVSVTSDNTGANVDCAGTLDWANGVWYSFDLPYDLNNVNIDFCGSPTMSTISAVLFTACSCDEADQIVYTSGAFYDCGDGWDVPSIDWMGVPGPVTVYYAVDFDVPGPFTFTVNVEELVPPENDDADKAEEIGEVADFPFSTSLATFDGDGSCQTAPNVWFCWTPTQTGLGIIDLCGSGYDTKMAVYDGCEVDVDGNPVGAQLGCNDDDSEICTSKALQSALQIPVVGGNTYLIEVGGYSSSVGEGDLSTTVIVGGVCCDPATGGCTDVADEAECTALGGNYTTGVTCAEYTCPPPPSEGDNCDDPLKVDIPGDLPYTDASEYTCGRFDNYPKEVLCYFQEYGYGYGDGEDAVYELTVSTTTTIEMTMDPKGTTYSYVEIRTDCPPTGGGCVYWFRSSAGDAYSSDPVTLDAGTYYLQVDTWPTPDCIPDFDLTITAYEECVLECPSGAVAEAETCGDDTNGGCSADPPTEEFEAIASGTTVCGTVWADSELRDLDWYEFTAAETGVISWGGTGEFPTYMWILDGNAGCDGLAVIDEGGADPCDPIALDAYVTPGTYWLLIAPDDWYDLPCDGTGAYGVDYTATFEFTPTAPQYCEASGGCDEYIENVTVGTINNTSACEGYGDFTAISTDFDLGGSYPITITIGGGYSSDYGAVWVDWNSDADFDDAGEAITLDVASGYGPYTGTIVVPGDAVSGATRMRVRLSYSTPPGPCGATSYGEAEDYTVTIGGGSAEPHMIIDPTTMHYADGNLVEDEIVTIYMGGNDIGFDMNDVDQGTVLVNGITPTSMTMGTYPDMTGDVLVIELSKIAFVQSYGLIWTGTDYTYGCTGSHTGGTFDEVADIDLIGHIPADVNLDGTVNILDIMYMINYKFKNGPAIDPIEVGDVNASGDFNILDILWTIDYKFKEGPEPIHP